MNKNNTITIHTTTYEHTMWQLEWSIYKNVIVNIIVQYDMYTLVIIMIVLVGTCAIQKGVCMKGREEAEYS